MTEQIRSVTVRVEVDTNKQTRVLELDDDDYAPDEMVEAVREFLRGDDHGTTSERLMQERRAGAQTALWNQANLVGQAIDQGQLDGTNGAAVAAAIRATTPEEFAKACEVSR